MPNLVPNASLAQLQAFVAELEMERGFARESTQDKCLLLGEEMGELFKAIRKEVGIGVDPNSSVTSAAEELADVLVFVLAIANRCAVDLEAALRAKENKNSARHWR
jgi:NTP pyrophosphatase (non-canonical NTP hydrolase)